MPTKNEIQARLAKAEAEIARLKARDTSSLREPSEVVSRIRAACHSEQESFVALLLDARQRVLACHEVHRGALSVVEVHPREIFREAVRIVAHSIILGHNHPSGDTEPSEADMVMTRRLVDAGKILGIPVLDHIIVTAKEHVSLAALGLIK